MATAQTQKQQRPSFLEALNKPKAVERWLGSEPDELVTVYGLTNLQAAQLLEDFGKLDKESQAVIKLIDPERKGRRADLTAQVASFEAQLGQAASGAEKTQLGLVLAQTQGDLASLGETDEVERFEFSYFRLGQAAQNWLHKLIAASLGEEVTVEDVQGFALEHLPLLLEMVLEANDRFFTGASQLWKLIEKKAPALGKKIQDLTGQKLASSSDGQATP